MFLGKRGGAENRGNVEKNGMDSKVSEPGFAGLKDDQDGDKKRISEKGHTAKNNHYIDEHPNRTLFFIFRFFVPLFDIFVPLWYLMILAGQVG